MQYFDGQFIWKTRNPPQLLLLRENQKGFPESTKYLTVLSRRDLYAKSLWASPNYVSLSKKKAATLHKHCLNRERPTHLSTLYCDFLLVPTIKMAYLDWTSVGSQCHTDFQKSFFITLVQESRCHHHHWNRPVVSSCSYHGQLEFPRLLTSLQNKFILNNFPLSNSNRL